MSQVDPGQPPMAHAEPLKTRAARYNIEGDELLSPLRRFDQRVCPDYIDANEPDRAVAIQV
jgi:hypothetical protein